MKSHVFLVLALLTAGCEPRREDASTVFAPPEDEHLCCIVVDMSGSFSPQMAGKAYEFTLDVADRFLRDHLGSKEKLVIAQLSQSSKSLLWHGTPQELKDRFRSAEDFHEFLKQHADPNGSRLYDGLAQVLDYVSTDHAVAAGAKPAVFVLSDMIDLSSDRQEACSRLEAALKRYTQQGGEIAFYWVAHDELYALRDLVQRATGQQLVMSEFIEKPDLPTWD